MRLSKNEPNFDAWDVYEIVPVELSRWNRWTFRHPTETELSLLTNVVECDDATGLVVQWVSDEKGQPVFTDGVEDIAMDNPTKLLLLLPNVKNEFLAHGFKPKLTSRYVKAGCLKIVPKAAK